MEIKDQVIIDGNAVYEIDDSCRRQIQTTSLPEGEDLPLCMLLLLAFFL